MASKYNVTDLLKFRSFVLDNPEIKPAEAIRIFNVKREDDNRQFVTNMMEYIDKQTKNYYWKEIGSHIRLEMLLWNFGFGIAYSKYQGDEFPHLITINFAIFSIIFTW